jgi:hypothetical protein
VGNEVIRTKSAIPATNWIRTAFSAARIQPIKIPKSLHRIEPPIASFSERASEHRCKAGTLGTMLRERGGRNENRRIGKAR